MAATFVLGIMVSLPSGMQESVPAAAQLATIGISPLALINDEDYEIFQLKVNNYDVATGEIDLSFSLASETHLSGNVADQQIHSLMAAALQDDINASSRLDAINALQAVVAGRCRWSQSPL